jgi:hypothetical protein
VLSGTPYHDEARDVRETGDMTNVPHSKSELLGRARHEARLSLGRAAFVRDARVLPIGVARPPGAAGRV